MNIVMACPAPRGSHKGNRVTADRWAAILQRLGHRVTIHGPDTRAPCDLLIALHARRSFPAISHRKKQDPQAPLVVALTGTDLYRDIRTSKRAQRSLQLADRLVVLQPLGVNELPSRLWEKTRVIQQSAEPLRPAPPRLSSAFEVAVLGHLRYEKDPFRTAMALRLLPPDSRIRVTHIGEALSDAMAGRARQLSAADPRYRWLGAVSRLQARRILARSHLLVHSSRLEGGANVISEALAEGVPILASHIPGNVGLLGTRYPGLFATGDTHGLGKLLSRAETDPDYLARLKKWCSQLAALVEPAREQAAWQSLLAELVSR